MIKPLCPFDILRTKGHQEGWQDFLLVNPGFFADIREVKKANLDWQDIMHANRALRDQKDTQLNKVDGIIEDNIFGLEKDSRILQKGRAK